MTFMVDVDPFDDPENSLYVVARKGERLFGVLIATRVPNRNGWFFEHFFRESDAPNGTVELLFDTAMRHIQSEGAEYAATGLAPLARLPAPKLFAPELPLQRRALNFSMHLSYTHLGRIYNFAGLHNFAQRLRPHRWSREFIAAPGGVGIPALWATLRAFSGGHLSFIADTLPRLGPGLGRTFWARVLRCIAGLLVPWTFFIANVDPAWLGGATAQRGWVAFDALMVCAIMLCSYSLERRHHSAEKFALALAACTTFDFLLTATGAFGLTPIGPVEWLLVVLAVFAPGVATLFLWCSAQAASNPQT